MQRIARADRVRYSPVQSRWTRPASDVHTNGIGSLRSMLERAHKGTFHKLSPKHLDRYVQEFAARHNLRAEDTIDIMAAVASGMRGKRLRYREPITPNELESGARSA